MSLIYIKGNCLKQICDTHSEAQVISFHRLLTFNLYNYLCLKNTSSLSSIFHDCFPPTVVVLRRIPVIEKGTLSIHIGEGTFEIKQGQASPGINTWSFIKVFSLPKLPFTFTHSDLLKPFGLEN